MSNIIEPRTLKGFRDSMPSRAVRLESTIGSIREALRLNGFMPIRTPTLEFEEILRGKGGEESERQMYTFSDPGDRRVGLRFDLTVPLARFVSQHRSRLVSPMSLYQWGSVWRGENTQRGRSREFVQFDFDILGADSALADTQILTTTHQALTQIGLNNFTIRVNDRTLLAHLLTSCGIDTERSTEALRSVDKLQKIGKDGVIAEMSQAGIAESAARQLLELVALKGPFSTVIDQLNRNGLANSGGLQRLTEIGALLESAKLTQNQFLIDLSIARGLEYYTGMVFETTIDGAENYGSICSGGRYDRLTAMFSKQEPLVGVGGSIGVDRLLDLLEEIQPSNSSARAPVFFIVSDETDLNILMGTLNAVRAAGIACEVYAGKTKLAKQMKMADKAGYELVVTVGTRELIGQAQIKVMATGEVRVCAIDSLADELG